MDGARGVAAAGCCRVPRRTRCVPAVVMGGCTANKRWRSQLVVAAAVMQGVIGVVRTAAVAEVVVDG